MPDESLSPASNRSPRRTRRNWALATAVVLVGLGALVWVANSVLRSMFPLYFFQPMTFESAQWKATEPVFSYESVRLRMVDDFLARNPPIGKTRAEIVELLGEPDQTEYFRAYDLVYSLGQERNFIGIDGEWLVIRLDSSERVQEARLVTD